VAVVESLAALVSNIGNYQGREYQELKRRVLAAHGRSRWEKSEDSSAAAQPIATSARRDMLI
jgi:hypothetical protein